jgi:protein TonB
MEKTLEKRHMSFDDLVFEGRNKAYGSYWLRKKYARYLLIAFLISLFGVSAGISVPVIRAYMFEAEEVVLEEVQEVQIDMIQVDDELAPIAPPPPPPSAAEAQVRYTAPVVVDTVMQEVQLATIDEVREIVTNEPFPNRSLKWLKKRKLLLSKMNRRLYSLKKKLHSRVVLWKTSGSGYRKYRIPSPGN